jgi:hypothetical protein
MAQFTDDLKSIGFDSYAEYLKSPLWASIRSRVYASKGRMCLDCKTRRATQIHHRQYDLTTLKGDTLNYLVPVCRQCHREEHGLEPPKPTVAPVVIPWNPKQRCPSKHKTPGSTLHARDKKRAKAKRDALRAKRNASTVRPKSVECKECRRAVPLPPDIAWADYTCDRCRKHTTRQATDRERISAARKIRERGEQIIRMARASVQADPNGVTGALREFMKSARMAVSLPTDCKRTRD